MSDQEVPETDMVALAYAERQVAQAEERLTRLREVVEAQSVDGIWNASSYWRGVANGLLLARHIMEGTEGDPPWLPEPESYLEDKPAPRNVEDLEAERQRVLGMDPWPGRDYPVSTRAWPPPQEQPPLS